MVAGFDNNAEVLVVTPLLADQLREAAEDASSRFDPVAFAGCNSGDACARGFIERFGFRAFRRPLSTEEVTRYLLLHNGIATESFELGLRWVVTAMLQSSNFLYRSELGTAAAGSRLYTLDPFEIATALSYGITGTMPDDVLFAAAQNGELSSSVEIEAQARRLFERPEALRGAHRFFSQWLGIDTLDTVPKDSALFPSFDADIRRRLRRELEVFVDWVIREEGGSLHELLTAPYTFVDADLAEYYGVAFDPEAPQRDGFYQVSYGSDQQAGLLTQGSVLATHARPNGSSPIHRGLLVRERMLCQELPPPPPGVNAEPPAPDENASDRVRYAAHSQDPACASCHRLIDPIGFGFERFDGIGRPRSGAVDHSGHITEEQSEAPFSGPQGLAQLLSDREDMADCFAEQYFRFSVGAAPDGPLRCALVNVQTAFKAQGRSIEALLLALVATPHFTARVGDPAGPEAEEPPPPPRLPPAPTMELTVDVHVDSDWGVGYCHRITVTNAGDTELDWSAVIDVDGTISTHWNAVASGDAGSITFSGVDWNNVINANETAAFGFCANR